MVKRACGFRGCKTLTEVDISTDIPFLNAITRKWCDKHMILYRKECDVLDSLVSKYNEMKIIDKRGKTRVFHHGNEVSNYLYLYNKKELDRILKSVR